MTDFKQQVERKFNALKSATKASAGSLQPVAKKKKKKRKKEKKRIKGEREKG